MRFTYYMIKQSNFNFKLTWVSRFFSPLAQLTNDEQDQADASRVLLNSLKDSFKATIQRRANMLIILYLQISGRMCNFWDLLSKSNIICILILLIITSVLNKPLRKDSLAFNISSPLEK